MLLKHILLFTDSSNNYSNSFLFSGILEAAAAASRAIAEWLELFKVLSEISVFEAPSSVLLLAGSTFIGGSAAIGAFGSEGSGGFGATMGCFLGSSVFKCVFFNFVST